MSDTKNSFKMNQMKVEEKEPLHGDNSSVELAVTGLKNGTNGAATLEIEIDENIAAETGSKQVPEPSSEVGLEEEFYRIIFAILIPYIVIGCPFNYCFDKNYQNVHKFMTSRCMKIYTCCISFIAHSILIFWFVRSAIHMFTLKHLNDDLIKDLWRLSYITAGVVALDIIWLNRTSIMDVLSNLLDYWPLSDSAKYQKLFTENICTLKCYRFKFTLLLVLSYGLAGLLLVYYGFLAFSIIRAYTDSDPEGYTHWWDSAISTTTIYALFFLAADAILLLSLLWATQYKIKHLNLYIRNLIKNDQQPDVSDIEIVKIWYCSIRRTTDMVDTVFAFYTVAFIGVLFLGIIYFVSQLVDIFQSRGVENAKFLSILGATTLMALILFYGLKEFADIHEHSSNTKSILYEYVLNTKPEERTTKFFEEVHFVTQGLLSKATSFKLLGQIELNKSFLVNMVLVIYSYAVLFHQFTQKIK